MSWRDAAKIAVFPGCFFLHYFGFNIVFCFISALHMTGYNIQPQKIYAEKDRKQENKKKWKCFPKPYKNCCPSFWDKYIIFFCAADPEILSCMGQFFNKEGGKRLKLVMQPNFWLQIGW